MKITDLLLKDAMILDLQASEKKAAIHEMVNQLAAANCINDAAVFEAGILAREEQTSTGLGDGFAMPHSKNKAVTRPTVLFAKKAAGLDYAALDGQPTYYFFMIAAPEGANDTHLQALASLSKLLMQPEFVAQLKNVETPDDVLQLFAEAETAEKAKEDAEAAEEAATPLASDEPLIVAVTACPTGIAHTYMAEDALKKKAKEMGVRIRVETNGSDGVKHGLTHEEINQATAVIIAADKQVEMARFDGKHLLNRPVSDGIRKTEELIQLALKQEAPVYHASAGSSSEEDSATDGSVGSRLYKILMNGISHMLPFVIGGGIAIAVAFLIDNILGVPQSQLSHLGSYNQAAAYFKTIGDAAFGFMLPVLAGFIASAIADRPGLVAGFVAGSLASAGGAGFLGALLGGFIAGYVMIGLKKVLAALPRSLEGIRTILFYPVFGVIITGFIMLLVNVPMKWINTGLNDFLNSLSGTSAILLGALVAGMMAVDLGGPINKAAYVFGTGTLTAAAVSNGGTLVMAAVMAGGMVPPLAIFFAALLFPKKFAKKDRQAGLTNFVMGLSFITEGAIPFAASDPLRIIPGFVAGSALTGALVGFASIKLMAPHGGIFVIFLLNKPLLYLLFILIGSLISAAIIGILRKPVAE